MASRVVCANFAVHGAGAIRVYPLTTAGPDPVSADGRHKNNIGDSFGRGFMGSFFDAAFAYPTAIYTALLGVVLFYWLLAVIGLVDFESSGWDVDLDVQADADPGDISTIATYVVAMGLNGVPFSVVVSLIVLSAWTVSCLAGMWLLPLVPTPLLNVIAGTAVLLTSFAVAIIVTARAIRPLRPLFVTHNAVSNESLVGQPCKVLTGKVDEKVGRAEVQQRGTGINVRVWARTPNQLTKGSSARIAEYDPGSGRYLIESEG
jgi:hypothetical protein